MLIKNCASALVGLKILSWTILQPDDCTTQFKCQSNDLLCFAIDRAFISISNERQNQFLQMSRSQRGDGITYPASKCNTSFGYPYVPWSVLDLFPSANQNCTCNAYTRSTSQVSPQLCTVFYSLNIISFVFQSLWGTTLSELCVRDDFNDFDAITTSTEPLLWVSSCSLLKS